MSEPSDGARRQRDRPWIFRTYAGHSTAHASNVLYRNNLGKGQTGLSVAFDLPTQTGYDSDDPMAAGEVGKVGVPIGHIDDTGREGDKPGADPVGPPFTIVGVVPRTRNEAVGEENVEMLGFVQSLLEHAAIPVFVADAHISVLEGSIGAFPRRLLVPADHVAQARRLVAEAGLAAELRHV